MATTAVNTAAAAAQTGATDTAAIGRTRLAENFDTFLSLLTTQLKNQDPLSPLDSNQFTQQLVQMTGVEQQLYTNDLLKSLVSNTASGVDTAVSLIGKEVRAVSDDAALDKGKAEWIYKLDAAAPNTKIEILDSKGSVIHAEAVTNAKAGDNTFTWDGKASNGSKYQDGTFTLRVTAKDASGTDINSTTYVSGLVTGVEQADGQTLVRINGAKIPWGQITAINQAAEPAKTASTNTTDTTPSTADDDETSPAAAG